jgi:hypothetical protein
MASGIYEKVYDGDPLPLGGAGFLAGTTPTETGSKTKEFVKWGFAIYESDSKDRDVAAYLQTAFADEAVKKAIRDIVAAVGGSAIAGAVSDAVSAFTRVLFGLLKKNRDDQLFLIEGTGVAVQGFNAHQPGESATSGNRFVDVRYAVNLVET